MPSVIAKETHIHQVLDSEASYRVVIDEQTLTITAADNCTEKMCTFIHNPSLLEPPSVAVDIVGCTTERIFPMDISSPSKSFIYHK